LCPQFPHDCRDPACCSFFGTAKIPRGLHVTVFWYFKGTRTMFDGKAAIISMTRKSELEATSRNSSSSELGGIALCCEFRPRMRPFAASAVASAR
jgi:hypothetical protein